MKPFTPNQEKLLLVLAIFGFIVPNGIFLYYAFTTPTVLQAAFNNPVSFVFMFEALLLMILIAWLIHRLGYESPGWVAFIIMSLVGSMVFSIPAFLYLLSRRRRTATFEAK